MNLINELNIDKMQKFKELQIVKVVDRVHGHEFEIGEIVRIISFDKDGNLGKGDYKCDNGISFWYLAEYELEEINLL